MTPVKPSRGSAPHGLPLRVEDLGLGHDVDDDSGMAPVYETGTLVRMSMPPGIPGVNPLRLEYPQSLAVYDDYAAAQKTVDFLSDNEFPVQHLMIVGTDLKRVERITGRLTTGRVALGGLLSGLWLGLFVGLVFSFFVDENVLRR